MGYTCEGSALGTIGLVDLALAFSLLAGVTMQGYFLPNTNSGCGDAVNWKNGTDGRNFFVVANATSKLGDPGGYSGVCRRIMLNWVLSIVVMYTISYSLFAMAAFANTPTTESST